MNINMVAHSCNNQFQVFKAGGSKVWGHPQQHNEYKSSLCYMRPCPPQKKQRTKTNMKATHKSPTACEPSAFTVLGALMKESLILVFG